MREKGLLNRKSEAPKKQKRDKYEGLKEAQKNVYRCNTSKKLTFSVRRY